jgi:hypothetical protein
MLKRVCARERWIVVKACVEIKENNCMFSKLF